MNFEDTYKENYPKVFRMASKMVNDEEVAGDIAQEVFAYLFERLQKGHAVLHPQSWLVRAAINKSVDYLKQREKHTSLSAVNEWASEGEPFEIRKTETILKQAIAMLKPTEMKLVMLYSEVYSYKQ